MCSFGFLDKSVNIYILCVMLCIVPISKVDFGWSFTVITVQFYALETPQMATKKKELTKRSRWNKQGVWRINNTNENYKQTCSHY